MKPKLVEVTDQKKWDQFLTAHPNAQIFQSWAWGEFRISQGSTVRRFAMSDEHGAWSIAAQLEFRSRYGVGYWFAQRGPILHQALSNEQQQNVLAEFLDELQRDPEMKKKSIFIRVEPAISPQPPSSRGSIKRILALDPSTTILLDLAPSTDELLARMHEKTRYNIRLAEKKGVTTRIASSQKDVDAFLDLMDETASRDKFVQHSRAYLQKTYDFLHERGMAQIRLAEWNGKVLCANLEVMFGDTVTYLYGASSSQDRNVMAPFALQWSAIQDAKQQGYQLYDFWGCNPESHDAPDYKVSWEGITRFKMGWGGMRAEYDGTFDLPQRPWLYRLAFIFR